MADDSRLPSFAVRRGVTFPDWAAVTSPATREALFAIFDAFGVERAWRDYTPAEDGVRTSLLRLYAELGWMPAIGELAKRASVSESTIRPILASLKARDLVVLDTDGGRIVGAYPWTDRETEHRVSLGERSLNALCAIDALGAGDMYRSDVEIHSRCRACGALITIATSDRGRAVAFSRDRPWSGRGFAIRTAAPRARSARSSPSSATTRIWRPGVGSTIPTPRAFACQSRRPFRQGARSSARASPGWS